VLRNDELTAEDAERLAPSQLVVSPGPGRRETLEHRSRSSSGSRRRRRHSVSASAIQAIVEAFGGEVGYARELLHGKASPVRHDGSGLFTGLPEPFDAGRYHSLAATRLPDELTPTAYADDGEVMAVRHRSLPIVGVQFHPESVLTPDGPALARNFLEGRL
jgi:anthranilate synthase component 2